MASPPVSNNASGYFYEQNGYYYAKDAAIGALAPELENKGLAEQPKGLDVAKPRLIDDPVSEST
jgi:hypothetical protein